MAPSTPRNADCNGHGTGTSDIKHTAYLRRVSQDPSLRRHDVAPAMDAEVLSRLLEAVGLEVAVRAWWRGTPGTNRTQILWLRSAAAGGLASGAKIRLARSGIPERVLDAGLQLGAFLKGDEDMRFFSLQHRGGEESFVASAVDHVSKRFVIRAASVTVQIADQINPSLILMPRTTPLPERRLGSPTNQVRMRKSAPLRQNSSRSSDRSRHLGSPMVLPSLRSGRTSAPPSTSYAPHVKAKDADDIVLSSGRNTKISIRDKELAPRPHTALALSSPHVDDKPKASDEPCESVTSLVGEAKEEDMAPRKSNKSFTSPETSKTGSPDVISHRKSVTADKMAEAIKLKKPAIGSMKYRLKMKLLSKFEMWEMENAKKAKNQQVRKEMEVEMKKQMEQDSEAKSKGIAGTGSAKTVQKKVVRELDEIARLFHHFDKDDSGFIEPHEFLPLLSRLMKIPASQMDMAEVWRNWDAIDVDGSGQISFEEFQQWYCHTFDVELVQDFTNYFNEEGLVTEDELSVREVARNVGVDNVTMEKIWLEFRQLTGDGNRMSKREFKIMLVKQLSKFIKSDATKLDVSPKVLEKFWLDVDVDKTGNVSFEEFAGWFVQFFHGDTSPMERYYDMLGSGYRQTMADFSRQESPGIERLVTP